MVEILSVPAIVIICYAIGMAVKNFGKYDKYIPLIVTVCGAILAVAAFYTVPDFIAKSWLEALAYGVGSGLVSVGINQIPKQLSKAE